MKHIITSRFWTYVDNPIPLFECKAFSYSNLSSHHITIPIQGYVPTEKQYETIGRGKVLYEGSDAESATIAKRNFDRLLRRANIVQLSHLKDGAFSVEQRKEGLVITDKADDSDSCLLFANSGDSSLVRLNEKSDYPSIIKSETTGKILMQEPVSNYGGIFSAEVIALLKPGETLDLASHTPAENAFYISKGQVTIYRWNNGEIVPEIFDFYSDVWRRRQESKKIVKSALSV